MLRTLVRRAAEETRPPLNVNNNPYKAKRLWPPDFSKLPPKHQFRLERKYRRRSQLKWARPRWNKFVKLAQWSTITFVVIYGVLFMDWSSEIKSKGRSKEENIQPFQWARDWYRRTMDSIWSKPSTPPKQADSSRSDAQ